MLLSVDVAYELHVITLFGNQAAFIEPVPPWGGVRQSSILHSLAEGNIFFKINLVGFLLAKAQDNELISVKGTAHG